MSNSKRESRIVFPSLPAVALAAGLSLALLSLVPWHSKPLHAADDANAKQSQPKTGAAKTEARKDAAPKPTAAAADDAPESSGKDSGEKLDRAKTAKYTTETLAGKVVWMSEALKRRFDVRTDQHSAEAMVVLETPAGQLHPIVPDQRGRAFMVDPRLRDIDVELFVRRYEGSPLVQVIRVYHVKPEGKYEVDYWCDLCAISMYILKPCECCQGPTRLRERLVEKEPAK
jgi:hypothetical protein